VTFESKPLGSLGWGPIKTSGVEGGASSGVGHPSGPAPLFAGTRDQLSLEAGDEMTAGNLDLLRSGVATTVVTGQQPGRLVGPLYTLFKIATAVEAAAAMTAAGRPAVPVFWSGDADDDLDEAMSPVCWDPVTDRFLDLPAGPGRKHPGRVDPMVGRLSAAETVRLEAAWLQRMAETTGHRLGRDLADIWNMSIEDGASWQQLQGRAIQRIFAGTGLVIVSGDNPALHEAARPLYQVIFDRLPELVEAGRPAGDLDREGGRPSSISGHSWSRPLFRVEGRSRVPVGPEDGPDQAGSLRPGVVFRSPIQDWLLRPTAVVVGPGEWAYLNELEPVYRLLEIPRSPLVPRMTGWLLPTGGVDPTLLETKAADLAGQLAVRVASAGREELERILSGELGLEEDRARELSRGRTRRWIKGLEAMLHDESVRALAKRRESYPRWVFPHGRRQERTLAAGCALAIWGDPLMEGVQKAAARHLKTGADGAWMEFGITVPGPAGKEGKP